MNKVEMLEEELRQTKIHYRVLIVVFILVGLFSTAIVGEQTQGNQTQNLLRYCEKITGKAEASFKNNGDFIGCETVIK